MIVTALAALVAASTTPPKPVIIVAPPPKVVILKPKNGGMPDLASMMAMFDRLFPPLPDPDPTRLGLARGTAQAMLPPGAFSRGMVDYMGGFADRILAMKQSDLEALGKPGAKLAATGKPEPTLRDQLIAEDPWFAEREKLTRAAIVAEFDRLSIAIEPKLREGLARTMAHRFTDKQLADINGFMATDSGRVLGANYLGMWFDPELMRAMVTTMPDWIMAMPGAAQRIEAATAHLPKPPKKDPKPATKAK